MYVSANIGKRRPCSRIHAAQMVSHGRCKRWPFSLRLAALTLQASRVDSRAKLQRVVPSAFSSGLPSASFIGTGHPRQKYRSRLPRSRSSLGINPISGHSSQRSGFLGGSCRGINVFFGIVSRYSLLCCDRAIYRDIAIMQSYRKMREKRDFEKIPY